VRGVRIKIVTKSCIILPIFVNEGIRFVQLTTSTILHLNLVMATVYITPLTRVPLGAGGIRLLKEKNGHSKDLGLLDIFLSKFTVPKSCNY
jgi:hypothetical protein